YRDPLNISRIKSTEQADTEKNKYPLYSFAYHYFAKNKYLGYVHNKIPTVFFSHQQDAGSQTEQIGRLFNFDDALTKREQIPNEMGLG
ncbi:hypothetical protein OFB93_26745, partial [Escherichia coli]|nr:hypothetical protein [Escherichia coli]